MRIVFDALCEKVFVSFRRRRMRKFFALFSPSADTRVLDIGGTAQTWHTESEMQQCFPVTLLNNLRYNDLTGVRFHQILGDATELPFANNTFDIAFSNSVIEHLGTWEKQLAFAKEARRVAPKLWIQTPARSFPIEPHLLAPYIQYLPKRWQHSIVRWTLRGLLTPDVVNQIVEEVRLLSYREVVDLFPDCYVLRERVCGMTKSYIAVRL